MAVQQEQILRDVRVFAVAYQGGREILVDVYGGPENVCGSVSLSFADAVARRRKVATLRSWQRRQAPVTLVTRDDHVVLVDDARYLEHPATDDGI